MVLYKKNHFLLICKYCNKSLSDTIVKSACINNMLITINEIIKYLKDNALTEIKGI
jgi:hypothetical protein